MANSPTSGQSGLETGPINIAPTITTEKELDLQEEMPEEKEMQPIIQMLFDTTKIDPDLYIIGPDDQFLLYLFGQLDKEYLFAVSPEGTVNIPTVGSVTIGGKTLAQAKEAISQEVLKKYKGITLSVNLSRARLFRIYVSGMVRREGAISAHSLMRVSDVMGSVGIIEATQRNIDANTARTTRTTSQRNIVVHRESGDIPVDLLRYQRFSDLTVNPLILVGDKIEVPPWLNNMFVYGEVNSPGRYEFKEGDRILDLVDFAKGLTAFVDSSRATLTSFDSAGKEILSKEINLYDALVNNPDAPQYKLHDSDRLSIWAKYEYKRIENVLLRGEVKYPGTYPITANETTLKQVIEMAGGFSDRADLDGARFVRSLSSSQELEYLRLSRMSVSEMTEEEYDFFKSVSRSRQNEISVDFVKLFQQNDTSYDVALQSGDMIDVPMIRGYVNVMGAVLSPGYLRVEPGKDCSYYIEKAGGFSWNAHKSKIRIIKIRTGQWFSPSDDVTIEAGDTIHISEKRPIKKWNAIRDAVTVLANAATIIILAQQIVK